MANPLVSLGILLRQMLIAISPIPPPTGQKAVISRSAVFLCVFVVVHAIGNLTAICGQMAFNEYAEMLHSRQVFLLVELYLGANVVGHAAMGIYKSFTNKFTRKSMGMDGGKFRPGAAQLILSGSVLTLFLIVHIKQFRLGHPDISGDIHSLAKQTLADPKVAAGYCAAVVALGFHLWKGWSSVVFSLKIDNEHLAHALVIGRVVVRLPFFLFPSAASIQSNTFEIVAEHLRTAVSTMGQCFSVCMSFVGAVAIFYSATDSKDASVLVKMVGAEVAASVPAEAVALGVFIACGACSFPVVWLVSTTSASSPESRSDGSREKAS